MKYTDAYAALIIPWLLTSGIKIVFIIIGSLILNHCNLYRKSSPNCWPDGTSKDAEEKEKTR
jgi:small conductance mechanosensitive channel